MPNKIESDFQIGSDLQNMIEKMAETNVMLSLEASKRNHEAKHHNALSRKEEIAKLAKVYLGLGANKNTGTTVLMALSAFYFPAVSQSLGAVKGVADETKQSLQISLQNSLEDLKRTQGDLSAADQKTHEIISTLLRVMSEAERQKREAMRSIG